MSDLEGVIQHTHYLARQPIFNRSLKVHGYELLFRSGLENFFHLDNGDLATSRVIADSFLLFGIENVTAGKPAFINFTRELILKDLVTLLPSKAAVIEILETVEPDEEIVEACLKLKKLGYTIALDDFVFAPKYEPLIKLADIIKIDILISSFDDVRHLVKHYGGLGFKLLAEKVENQEEFKTAKEIGFSYFQGYFFSRPIVMSHKDVPGVKSSYLAILEAVNRTDIDYSLLDASIRNEVSISYKLLKYINSVGFGLRRKVHSVKQAITLLGEQEIQKWINLVVLADMAGEKPDELLISSLIRARFCETMAALIGLGHRSAEIFLMGMLSMIDAILDIPLDQALAQLPIPDEVKSSLLGAQTSLRPLLDLAISMERAHWNEVLAWQSEYKVGQEVTSQMYLESIQWTNQIYAGGL